MVQFMRKVVIVLLITASLTACSLPLSRGVPRVSGATPEEVVQRHVPNLGRPAPGNVRVHGTRVLPQGTLVLYTADAANQGGPSTPLNMGYALTKQHGATWQVEESTYGGGIAEGGQLIEYHSAPLGSGGRPTDWIVYGRVLDPTVVIVEASFDTGQVVHDSVTGAMFGLVAPAATTVCDVRLLNAQGQVLQRLDPTQARAAPPDAQARVARCPAP